jgi:hypothetical protein
MKTHLLSLLALFCAHSVIAAELDRYGGNTALKGKATGWFHTEQIGGRWFFITPEGNAFFSLGVTHTGETIRQDERGVFASRFENSEEKMGAFFLQNLRDWGFNSAGYGALEMMETQIPYVATIWTEGPRSKSAGPKSQNTDLFDPAVQERLRGKVRAAAKRHVSNPWCLGHVFIDLPIWSLKANPGPTYVEFLRSLPAEAPGHQALKALPQADDGALTCHIAETYYALVCDELRKADPHHLILGDRFMVNPDSTAIHTPDAILKVAARFVDAFAFQPMGTQKPLKTYLDHVLALTGKPSLLADVNTMTSRPEKDLADTTVYETQAGEHTLAYYLDAASSPACLGLHRCTLRDYFPWNPQFHRRGLLKADDSPYPLLIDFTRRTNHEVLQSVYHLKPR